MRLLPVTSLMMNSQESSATGYLPHELFMGRPAWFLHAPYPEDSYSTVGKWVKEQQDKVDKSKKKCFSNALGYTLVVLEML